MVRNSIISGFFIVALLLASGCAIEDVIVDDTPQPFDELSAVEMAEETAMMGEGFMQIAADLGANGAGRGDWEYLDGTWYRSDSLHIEEEGYTSDVAYDYTVQYFDADSNVVEGHLEATRLAATQAGTATGTWIDGETVATVDFDILGSATCTGLNTAMMTAAGEGGYNLHRVVTVSDITIFDRHLVVSWETGGNGLEIPEGGYCPTGTILYDMAPYHMVLTFDGSTAADYILYDADDAQVPGGGGTHTLDWCDPVP